MKTILLLLIFLFAISIGCNDKESSKKEALNKEKVNLIKPKNKIQYWGIEDFYEQLKLNPFSDTLFFHSLQIERFPKEFYQTKNIKFIIADCISKNCLTSLSSEISNFQKLTSISLSKTGLLNLPKEIGDLKNLKTLRVFAGGELKSIPEEIGKLQELEILDLWRNDLTTLPESISKLKNLKLLKIGENNFTSEEKKRIKRLLPNCEIKYDY